MNRTIWAILVMLLWGSLFPTVKLGYQVYGISTIGDILLFAGVRFTICGGIICLYSFMRNKENFLPVKKTIAPILLSGVFAIILHYSFTYTGLQLTDSSKTAILKQLGALFYVCFSAVFFKEDRLTLRKLVGVLLGFTGIVVINISSGRVVFQLGDILIIAASFCTVFSNVISKKVLREVNAVVFTGVSQLFGGIILLLIGMFTDGDMVALIPKNGSQFLVLAGIVITSVISYCLWFAVVKKENLSRLFIIKFLEPFFAAVFSWILLGEDIFKINYVIAFILICMGIAVANKN